MPTRECCGEKNAHGWKIDVVSRSYYGPVLRAKRDFPHFVGLQLASAHNLAVVDVAYENAAAWRSTDS